MNLEKIIIICLLILFSYPVAANDNDVEIKNRMNSVMSIEAEAQEALMKMKKRLKERKEKRKKESKILNKNLSDENLENEDLKNEEDYSF